MDHRAAQPGCEVGRAHTLPTLKATKPLVAALGADKEKRIADLLG